MQVPQLFRIDAGRRVRHHVHGGGGLGKRDDFADRALVRQQRRNAVEPERDPAVRRGAELEGVKKEAKAKLRLVFGDAEELENEALQRLIVNSDAAAADFAAVQDQVVGPGARAHMDDCRAIAKALKARLSELTSRVEKIDNELRKPLSADSEDQATDLENQDALGGIEYSGLQEIQQIKRR